MNNQNGAEEFWHLHAAWCCSLGRSDRVFWKVIHTKQMTNHSQKYNIAELFVFFLVLILEVIIECLNCCLLLINNNKTSKKQPETLTVILSPQLFITLSIWIKRMSFSNVIRGHCKIKTEEKGKVFSII